MPLPFTLKNSRTDAKMADTSIILMNYLKTQYQIITTPVPLYVDINFDTKFARMEKHNQVIIERMPNVVTPQILGGGRFAYQDTKRIQIACSRTGAIDNGYNLERNLDDIINGNPIGMQANGVDFALISNFTPIVVRTEQQINEWEAEATETTLYRSFALATLYYNAYKA